MNSTLPYHLLKTRVNRRYARSLSTCGRLSLILLLGLGISSKPVLAQSKGRTGKPTAAPSESPAKSNPRKPTPSPRSSALTDRTDDCPRAAVPRLSGTMIQPDKTVSGWGIEQWKAELRHMREAGITQLILQWTADSKSMETVYPTKLPGYKIQDGYGDVVGLLLDAAETEEVDVYLGLQTNVDWEIYTKPNDSVWFEGEIKAVKDLAGELWERYHDRPGFINRFKGWYLRFEVDNDRFKADPARGNIINFYKQTGEHLHAHYPNKLVMIAPFYNTLTGQNSSEWRGMWAEILTRAPIDVMALQDGVGPLEGDKHHATTQQLPEWFKATRAAVDEANAKTNRGIRLWADTETYIEEPTATGRNPLSVKTLVEDMRAVRCYVSNYISFSYNHYMSPQQGWGVVHKTYLSYVNAGNIDNVAPSVPANLKASPGGGPVVELGWAKSTDNTGVAGYRIYRGEAPIKTIYVKEGDNCLRFRDESAAKNTSYDYSVSAIDAAGNESGLSAAAKIKTSPYTDNAATYVTYTASMEASKDHPDEGGAELTDGTFGDASDYAPWQGRNTNQKYSFVIDLGEDVEIREIVSEWLQNRKDFVLLPKSVRYDISLDNKNFETVGVVSAPADEQCTRAFRYVGTGVNKVGRYVRVEVEPAGSWSMVSEVQVIK
jgi:hypothetical protein